MGPSLASCCTPTHEAPFTSSATGTSSSGRSSCFCVTRQTHQHPTVLLDALVGHESPSNARRRRWRRWLGQHTSIDREMRWLGQHTSIDREMRTTGGGGGWDSTPPSNARRERREEVVAGKAYTHRTRDANDWSWWLAQHTPINTRRAAPTQSWCRAVLPP